MRDTNSHPFLRVILLCTMVLLANNAFSQFPAFNKETRMLKKADQSFTEKNYVKAIDRYKDYLDKYEGNTDVWYKLAVSYKEMNEPDKATSYYKKIVKTDDETNPIVHLSLGQVYMVQGKYDEARKHFLKYNQMLEFNDQLAMRYISSIENIERYYTDSSYYTKENLPVNSKAADFGATTVDKSFFFLSTRNKRQDYNEKYSSDLFVAEINNSSEIESPKRLGGPANTRFGEIGYAIVPQTNEIFICRFEPGQQDEYSLGYNVYKAYIDINSEISRPSRVELEKFRYAIAYPTVSKSAKFMIFASDAPGGYGGWDLYKADYTSNGIENIRNMGDKVNSAGDELYPFLLNDTVIFFATDGHGGLGGFDIYSKNIAATNEYARNLGYPVNSSANDYAIYFDSGLTGYFTSNREGGVGNADIYRFAIHQLKLVGEITDQQNGENLKNVNIKVNRSGGEQQKLALADNGQLKLVAKPGEELEVIVEKEGYETRSFEINTSDITFLGGHTLQIGKLSVQKLEEPEVDTFKLEPVLVEKDSVKNIFFSVQIAAGRREISEKILNRKYNGDIEIVEMYDGKYYRYVLGKHRSYFEAKEIFKTLKIEKSFLVAFKDNEVVRVMKALREVHVEPAEAKDPEVHDFIGKTMQVSSDIVYYGLDSFRIPDDAISNLEESVKKLNENPNYFLEIAAHTDKRGSDMYNRALSEERARFLREYFIGKGIDKLRIISHGIGEKQLRNYCVECSEKEHKQNRRAELILREYKNTISE